VSSPPLGPPPGRLFPDDSALIGSFLAGGTDGHSARFHIEERVLYRDRMEPAALALGRGAFLVRGDEVGTEVERVLVASGNLRIERDAPLGAAVALQAVGLPAARWDLWATDREEGRWRLEASAENWWVGPHHPAG
jgi:hypothetical protein